MLDKDAWIALIQQEITKNNPAIDVEFGPVYDTIIAPMATVLERIDNRLDYIKSIVDINKWSEWTDEDLESIAANYGVQVSILRMGRYHKFRSFFSLLRIYHNDELAVFSFIHPHSLHCDCFFFDYDGQPGVLDWRFACYFKTNFRIPAHLQQLSKIHLRRSY